MKKKNLQSQYFMDHVHSWSDEHATCVNLRKTDFMHPLKITKTRVDIAEHKWLIKVRLVLHMLCVCVCVRLYRGPSGGRCSLFRVCFQCRCVVGCGSSQGYYGATPEQRYSVTATEEGVFLHRLPHKQLHPLQKTICSQTHTEVHFSALNEVRHFSL